MLPITPRQSATAAVVLLGAGVVGGAFLKLLDTPAAASLRLVGVANSRRQQTHPQRLAERRLRECLLTHGEARDDAALLAALQAGGGKHRVIIDATASAETARNHPRWLADGYHVVTANKAQAGGTLAHWQGLRDGARAGCTRYGDAATVGAGLPVLSTLRRLHACGDTLLGLEGVFSGSLSWLFNQYDGRVPFSTLLRRAQALGYSEPDPRADLSGQDVARKLLILARSAGFALDADAVDIENLVPEALRALDAARFMDRSEALDVPMATRLAKAAERGDVLRYLARLDRHGRARVGLCVVPPGHPAARLTGTDNQFALTTARYAAQPLVIQGPGAGADVTAQALLGDILACVAG